jgi:prophage regulatory protein
MINDQQFTMNIPQQFIDSVAEQGAKRVIAHLERHQPRRVQQPIPPTQPPERSPDTAERPTFLRLGEVTKRIGLSRATVYLKMSKETFPQSVKLGARSVAWRLDDIEKWELSPGSYTESH